MSVRITESTGPYALYDSVTGLAFGEVFESQYDAEDFLEWAAKYQRPDIRTMTATQLAELRVEWSAHLEKRDA